MSGRRAAYRVARKNALRNRKRTVFLVLLVAVPVALGVVVAGIVRATNYTPVEQAQLSYGAADVKMEVYFAKGEIVNWVYQSTAEFAPDVEITDFRRTGVRFDGYVYGSVIDLDLSNPLTEGMFVVTEGEAPNAEGQVAVSPAVAQSMGLEIGDIVEFDNLDLGELRLVGIISEPIANSGSTIMLPPGGLTEFSDTEFAGTTILLGGEGAEEAALRLDELWWSEGRQQFWPKPAVDPKPVELEFLEDETYVLLTEVEIVELVELANTTDPTETDPFSIVMERAWEMVYVSDQLSQQLPQLQTETRAQFLSQPQFESNPTLFSTGVAALLLVEVAFITGAAFAAGTRRRLREIGLLGANGATEKHVRATVVGEGLAIGLIGSAGGVLLGIAVLVLARPWLQPFVTRLITGVGVSLADVLGPIAVALVSVLIAVWVPARTASKIPTTTALQGRMPSSSPRKWVIPFGLGSSGFGALLITVSLASDSSLDSILVGVGGVLVVGGVAMLASPILAGVSTLSDHVPATSRLVLRDSGRHRTRSAVAVAAIMVILLAPVIFMTVAATSAKQNLVYGLPSPPTHLLVSGSYGTGFGGSEPIDQADVAALAAIVPEETIATFDALSLRTKTNEQLEIEKDLSVRSTISLGIANFQTAVASESLLNAIADERVSSAIADDQIVVLGIEDKQTIVSLNDNEYPAQEFAVPIIQWAMPRVLLPESVASQFTDADSRMLALLILERPLTDQEHQKMSATLTLETSGGYGTLSNGTLYAIALGATLLVVLIVIALVTAVSAAEVDEEIQTIVAVGAPGSFRRRFLGLLTGYQTLIAAALAVPLGLGLVKVFSSANSWSYVGPFGEASGSAIVFPWLQVAGFALVIPLVVGLLTWISVRSAPVTPPRRAA